MKISNDFHTKLNLVWYNLHISNEQCELEHKKIFVVLARKKIFLCSNS